MPDSEPSGEKIIEQVAKLHKRKANFESVKHDMAESNKIQERLKDLYWSIMENAYIGVTLIDANYKILMANSTVGINFNKSVCELIGRKCFQEFEKRESICPHCPGRRAIATGQRAETETEGVRDDGSRFSVRIQAFPTINPDGTVTGFIEILEDITEHKRTEQALKESEERFRGIYENALVGLYRTTPDGRILMANPALVQMLGYSTFEELAQRNLEEEGFSLDCLRSVFKQRVEAEGQVIGLESKWIRRDGTIVFVRESARAIRDNEGAIQYYEGTVEDITDRKRTEEALRESEEKFRSLAEQSPNMIFINKKKRIVYANKKCEEVMGYKREEFYSPDFDFLVLIAPESVDLIKKNLAKHLRGEEVPPYDYSLIKKNGERIEAINTSKLIQYEGELAILGIATDITERKKAEQALRDNEHFLQHIFDGIRDGISILDRDLNIIRANKWMEDTNAPQMPLVGKKCYQAYRKRKSFCQRCPSIRAIENGEAYTEVMPAKFAENRIGWVELSAFPLKNADGSIIGVIEHIKDITKRKRAEQKLLEDQAQLKSLASQLSLTEERERHRLAMELHDQIGQSLVISKIKLDSLRKSASSNELTEALENVCSTLGKVIQDVSSLTFDLSFPVLYELGFEAAVAEWLSEQIRDKHGIETEFEDDEQFKPLDDDICVLLFRDVRELLVNVVKHAKAQNVKVSINKSGDRICVSVEDDGVGFNPVEVTSRATERAEFGLFSIRQRLEQLGGHFEIESEPGRGSKITMTAPLRHEMTADGAQI